MNDERREIALGKIRAWRPLQGTPAEKRNGSAGQKII
jgi:hypothetical protein